MYELFKVKCAESGIEYEYYSINVCTKFSLKFGRLKVAVLLLVNLLILKAFALIFAITTKKWLLKS